MAKLQICVDSHACQTEAHLTDHDDRLAAAGTITSHPADRDTMLAVRLAGGREYRTNDMLPLSEIPLWPHPHRGSDADECVGKCQKCWRRGLQVEAVGA